MTSNIPPERYRTDKELDAMRTFIKKLTNILEQQGVKYFAQGGTLLGAVRDGNIIPWDYDFDLCIPLDQYSKLIGIQQSLADADLEMVDGSETGIIVIYARDGVEYPVYQYMLPDSIKFNENYLSQTGARFPYCDINLVAQCNSEPFYYYCTRDSIVDDKFIDWRLPLQSVEQLEQCQFLDGTISVPSNAAEYLKLNYGSDCLENGSLAKWTDGQQLNPYSGFKQCWYLLNELHRLEGDVKHRLAGEIDRSLEANIAAIPDCIATNSHLESQLLKLRELMENIRENLFYIREV